MAFQLHDIKSEDTKEKRESVITTILQREISLGKTFSNKAKEDFYTEVSLLLKAGITLKEALELLQKAQKKQKEKELMEVLNKAIVSGRSFSEAMQLSQQFTNYEYFSVKIGEETGTLAQVCGQLAGFFASKNEQRRILVSAMTYPIIILVTATLVLVFMLHYVVPMFQDIFRQQKVELPGITKFIIKVSNFTDTYGLFILFLLIGLILLRSLFNKQDWFRKIRDKLVLKLPFIGNFVKTVYLSQFTQAAALLTASKIPVVNSIQLIRQMLNFHPLQTALEDVEANLLRGQSLSESLKAHKLFDDKMVALVKVAEETNQNEFIFERLNTQYATQVQQRSKMLSTVMEPFIILIVGALVGFILIAMYLPMFKLSSVLG